MKILATLLIIGLFVHRSYGDCELDGDTKPHITDTALDTQREPFRIFTTTNVQSVSIESTETTGYPYMDVSYDEIAHTLTFFPKAAFESFEEIWPSNNTGAPTLTLSVRLECANSPSRVVGFHVRIEDTNNHDPVFSNSKYEYKIPMPFPTSIDITQFGESIIVTDIDITNTRVEFSIKPEHFFIVYDDPLPGSDNKMHQALLKAKEPLRFVESQPYEMTVTDFGDPRRSTSATIIINIDDEASVVESPVFEKAFTIGEYKSDEVDEFYTEVSLSAGANARVSLSEPYYEYFKASNNADGTVSVALSQNLPLDSIMTPFIVLTLTATLDNAEAGAKMAIIITLPVDEGITTTTECPIVTSPTDCPTTTVCQFDCSECPTDSTTTDCPTTPTDCPTTPTDCPTTPTDCPTTPTDCPTTPTDCPTESTPIDCDCPTTPTDCPTTPTDCPTTPTDCPTESTPIDCDCPTTPIDCPTTPTDCPTTPTDCPTTPIDCPTESTPTDCDCPTTPTDCPTESTPTDCDCPTTPIDCPTTPTDCPTTPTDCPTTPTDCSTTPTDCPTTPTDCPTTPTDCPTESTPTDCDCPTTPIDCPTTPTDCPTESTPTDCDCPTTPIDCPTTPTDCPTTPTDCPTTPTDSPTESTPIDCDCPTTPTDCPTTPTDCPTTPTDCPTTPTDCPTESTPIDCDCPTTPIDCPTTPTDCPTTPTDCPTTPTDCPTTPTDCPTTPTDCSITPTDCPTTPTDCPTTPTDCPTESTPTDCDCPTTPTDCPTTPTDCPTTPIDCPTTPTDCSTESTPTDCDCQTTPEPGELGMVAHHSLLVRKVLEGQDKEILISLKDYSDIDCHFEIKGVVPDTDRICIDAYGNIVANTLDRESSDFDGLNAQYTATIRLKEGAAITSTCPSRFSPLQEMIRSTKAVSENQCLILEDIRNEEGKIVVAIIVEDANDNAPNFEPNSISIGYPEQDMLSLVSPAYIMQAQATDDDIGINAELAYEIVGSDRVVIRSDSGYVYPTDDLYDSGDLTFQVIAKDQNGDGLTSNTLSVTVNFLKQQHICVIAYKNQYLEAVDEILSTLSTQAGPDVNIKYLSASVLPTNDLTRSARDDNDNYLVIIAYAFSQSTLLTTAELQQLLPDVDDLDISALPNTNAGGNNNNSDDDDSTTGLLTAVIVLAILLAIGLIGFIALYLLKFRKTESYSEMEEDGLSRSQTLDNTLSPQFVKNKNLAASKVDVDVQMRRPTGIVLSSQLSDDDLTPTASEEAMNDQLPDRRKSVAFNAEIEEISIERDAENEGEPDSEKKESIANEKSC